MNPQGDFSHYSFTIHTYSLVQGNAIKQHHQYLLLSYLQAAAFNFKPLKNLQNSCGGGKKNLTRFSALYAWKCPTQMYTLGQGHHFGSSNNHQSNMHHKAAERSLKYILIYTCKDLFNMT